ncbi:hypothetical protein EAF04_007493 [Stromatinia cepivora]|nr:hypothetical protein EAF04_007493 [Stromatinia cepivora]
MVDSIYVKRHIPGKGLGLVATQDIPKGTRILSEVAFLIAPNTATRDELRISLVRQWEAFSEDQRQEFLSFHNTKSYGNLHERLCGIYSINALPLQEINNSDEKANLSSGPQLQTSRGGIFLDASRINHACDENAVTNWNEAIQQLTVTASKDIHKDEEITIYYLAIRNHRKFRRANLQEKFQFLCSCRLCSLPPKERKDSDRQLNEIIRLRSLICGRSGESAWSWSRAQRKLHELDELVCLYKEQNIDIATLSYVLIRAADLAICHSDLARGKIFAERAISGFTTVYGSDCAELEKWGPLVNNPSKYKLYGRSREWSRAIDAVPAGLNAREFEDWLWRRRDRLHSGEQITDFRSRTIFPSIRDLPFPYHGAYYDRNEKGYYRARVHWCFFGEITHTSKFGISALAVKDIDGKEIKLVFDTEEKGEELPPGLVRENHTVSIINAQPYKFPVEDDNCGGKVGIRHDDELLLKIFPLSLQELFALNDLVQQFSKKINGVRKCHGCGKESAAMEQCKRCLMFWYCDRACQTVGWNQKGHKDDCKIFKNHPDLRRMFLLDWKKYDPHVQFPLPAATK